MVGGGLGVVLNDESHGVCPWRLIGCFLFYMLVWHVCGSRLPSKCVCLLVLDSISFIALLAFCQEEEEEEEAPRLFLL